MFPLENEKKHFIDKSNNNEIGKTLKQLINRYNLKYSVSTISIEKAVEVWDDFGSELVYFKFQSVEFPILIGYSANNPEVIE